MPAFHSRAGAASIDCEKPQGGSTPRDDDHVRLKGHDGDRENDRDREDGRGRAWASGLEQACVQTVVERTMKIDDRSDVGDFIERKRSAMCSDLCQKRSEAMMETLGLMRSDHAEANAGGQYAAETLVKEQTHRLVACRAKTCERRAIERRVVTIDSLRSHRLVETPDVGIRKDTRGRRNECPPLRAARSIRDMVR